MRRIVRLRRRQRHGSYQDKLRAKNRSDLLEDDNDGRHMMRALKPGEEYSVIVGSPASLQPRTGGC